MIDLAILKQSLTDHGDIRPKIALFIEPEAWGDFSQLKDFARFEPLLQEMVLSLFPESLCLLGKTKEESLFLLLEDLGIQLPSSDKPACYRIVWDFIKCIRANPARVSAEQKVMFALMFPKWLRSVLSEKERQVAHITAVLLRRSRSAPPVQEIDFKTQVTQWLFCGQAIHTVLSALWHQGHVRLVLWEIFYKMHDVKGDLSLEGALDLALQHCFKELKDFCQKHALTQNSSLEELSKKSIEDDSLSQYAHALELLVLAGVDLRHIRIRAGQNLLHGDNFGELRTPDGQSLLHFAASQGYIAMTASLLATGIDVNCVNAQQQTALHIAASLNQVAVVERLLAIGVDTNLADQHRDIPLSLAASRGHAVVVAKLLAAGVDDTLLDEQGCLALLSAAQYGRCEIIEILLAAGVDAKRTSQLGHTALHFAAQEGHAAVVEKLLAVGVDPNRVDEYGQTALHRAALQGHVEVVARLIAAGVDANLADRYGATALHCAADKGQAEVIETLLVAGVNANRVNAQGETALDVAVGRCCVRVVKQLLAARVDVHFLDVFIIRKRPRTPLLHLAVGYGYGMHVDHAERVELIELLLAAGADPHLVDRYGKTALHHAASSGKAEVIELLLAAGANPHLVDGYGQTALHHAAYHGKAEMIEPLLAAGVDANRVDAQGKTALDVAIHWRHDRVVEQLQAAIRQRPSP